MPHLEVAQLFLHKLDLKTSKYVQPINESKCYQTANYEQVQSFLYKISRMMKQECGVNQGYCFNHINLGKGAPLSIIK
jgi:hypothetical protein